jgi:hypothetical protein
VNEWTECLGASSFSFAQTHADLAKQAKVTIEQARAAALARQPGTVKSSELEREHGKLLYSFDIAGNDKKIHEVQIDAITGQVLSNTIESKADEQRERATESKKQKKSPKN